MRDIRLVNVTKSFHSETILEGLSLTIPAGTFFALLGPSGCGKTTLLRLIAGFEKADAGHVYLGDTEITYTPINERRVNTVFQNYALFPHMNVFENVAYGLRMRGKPQDEVEERVVKLLSSFGLDRHIRKSITRLSGGEQQRVAIARSIINEPDVLLLDEPLAALDFKLREKMLIELIELQDSLKTTFIYVTHDQFEALTVSDQMAIMNPQGEIEQIGTPKNIYEFPLSAFVARFVGTTNTFSGTLKFVHDAGYLEVQDLGSFAVDIPRRMPWMTEGKAISMSVRPEKIMITKHSSNNVDNVLRGTVASIVYHGRSTQYNVRVPDYGLVHVFQQNEEHIPRKQIDYDDAVYLYWQKENAVLLER